MSILPDAETFRRLADGSLSGPGPAALRSILAALAVPYAAAVAIRNDLYDRGLLPQRAATIPVVSVGNLTLGGTGKTPLVAWLARELIDLGRRPAVVSRGYAARPAQTSDEAAELAILLPGVPHVADRDRTAATERAAGLGADVVVLDDGFQHRRLLRNLDILTIDATDPFGCNRLVPRGLLREPLAGLARSDAIVLSRADRIDADGRAAIRSAVARARRGRPLAAWVETTHAPVGLRSFGGAAAPLESLAGRRVLAFCGIGNPAAFRHTLSSLGATLVGFRSFADHHHYSTADLDALAGEAATGGAELLVTTLKDLVRLGDDGTRLAPLVAVEVALEPLTDPEPLKNLVALTLRGGAKPA